MVKNRFLKKTAAALAFSCMFVFQAFQSSAAEVDYDNLRQMIADGNPTVKYNSSSTAQLENQIAALKEECESMVSGYKYDTDESEYTKDEYKSTAANLSKSIKQLEKQLKKQTGSSSSYESTLDMYEMQAQAAYTSYLAAELNAEAAEKTAEAKELQYQNALTRQSAGMSTDSSVTDAHSAMLNAQTSALSLRQQADSLRRSLLEILGLNDDGTNTFKEVSVPDLNEIAAIDKDADQEKAVNNDASVISVRHTSSTGTVSMNLKNTEEEIAVGNATQDYLEAYTQLMTSVDSYNAAQGALAAAEADYQGAQRKKSLGMLTEADWLTSEAAHLQATASYKTACMNLRAAYENYKWLLKGDSSGSGASAGTR